MSGHVFGCVPVCSASLVIYGEVVDDLNGLFVRETDDFWLPVDFTGIIEYTFSLKLWYKNGVLHRLDGPSYISTIPEEVKFFVNGRLHRLDGPAVERVEDNTGPGHKEWWVNGKHVMEIEHNLLCDMMKLKGLI